MDNNLMRVFRENAPIKEGDLIYVADRQREIYAFPLHTHEVYELNFTMGGKGIQRVVGDSIEYIDEFDLVFLDGDYLEHGWFNPNNAPTDRNREITIQFSRDLINTAILDKRIFAPLKDLLERSKKGVCFNYLTIQQARPLILALTSEHDGFQAVMILYELLNILSAAEDTRTLSSDIYASSGDDLKKRGRLATVLDYIHSNFQKPIQLHDLAQLVNMSDAGFSRYFKNKKGMNVSEYILDYRLSRASSMIAHTEKTISEICYAVGIDNVSYFHRQFKRRKGCTPNEFRKLYSSKQTII